MNSLHAPLSPAIPTKEEMAALPPFEGLPLERITVVASAAQAAAAVAQLLAEPVVGFDTESRPTFAKGEVSEGPHVVQFATLHAAWLFQLQQPASIDAVATLLASTAMSKVGFGLGADNRQLLAKLGTLPNAVLDLNALFRARGYRKSIGARTAVAIVFNQRFFKSKRMSTSNWAYPRLSDRQVLYAANDAYAAIRVFSAMGTEASTVLQRDLPPIVASEP
jgi:ribonuclease D